MKWKIIILTIALLSFAPVLIVARANTDTVDTTVKLSVCGDAAVEGPEDCEGYNLNSKNCLSLGFSGGALGCDIACSFDTTSCFTITPTPIVTQNQTNASTVGEDISSLPLPQPLSSPIVEEIITRPSSNFPPSVIPSSLVFFDVNNTGRIEVETVREVVTLWVDEWKKYVNIISINPTVAPATVKVKCDVNGDKQCNLLDFSVLLAYFE